MRLLGHAAAAPHLDHLTAARPRRLPHAFVIGAAGTPDGHSLSRMWPVCASPSSSRRRRSRIATPSGITSGSGSRSASFWSRCPCGSYSQERSASTTGTTPAPIIRRRMRRSGSSTSSHSERGWCSSPGGRRELAQPELDRSISFWALAVALVSIGRVAARTTVRRLPVYVQSGIVVGAGNVGQLVARKIQQHPEYGIKLVGFVDENPRERRPEIADLPLLGGIDALAELVESREIDRVIVAFSGEADDRTMSLVRSLRDEDVIVDVVPRLFELVGPRADIHLLEGLPLVTVPPARLRPSSRIAKRVIDVAGASVLLALTAPVFALAAIRIRRESPGPVFFRQTRLGTNRRPFTALKFRTMKRRHRRCRAPRIHPAHDDGRRDDERKRDVQALTRGRRDAVRPVPAQDEPRRAAAADQRAARRDVARRPAPLHPVRDGVLPAAPLRPVPRARRASPVSGR